MAGRDCSICTLPLDQRRYVEFSLVRGDTYEEVAELAGVSAMTINRHATAGHISVDPMVLRDWLKKNPRQRGLERSAAKALAKAEEEASVELTKQDVLKLMMVFMRHAMGLVESLEASQDFRGAGALLSEARKCVMDAAALQGYLRAEPEGVVTVRVEKRQLIDSIETLIKEKVSSGRGHELLSAIADRQVTDPIAAPVNGQRYDSLGRSIGK